MAANAPSRFNYRLGGGTPAPFQISDLLRCLDGQVAYTHGLAEDRLLHGWPLLVALENFFELQPRQVEALLLRVDDVVLGEGKG